VAVRSLQEHRVRKSLQVLARSAAIGPVPESARPGGAAGESRTPYDEFAGTPGIGVCSSSEPGKRAAAAATATFSPAVAGCKPRLASSPIKVCQLLRVRDHRLVNRHAIWNHRRPAILTFVCFVKPPPRVEGTGGSLPCRERRAEFAGSSGGRDTAVDDSSGNLSGAATHRVPSAEHGHP